MYFHRNFRRFHIIPTASTTALTDTFVLYTTVPPVEITTFRPHGDAHCVRDEGGFHRTFGVAFHWARVRLKVYEI